MSTRRLFLLIKEAVEEFLTDNCLHLAAAVSYYVLFSLFPLALAAISVLGFVLGSPEVEAEVIEEIGNLLPVSGSFITSTIRGVVRARGVTGLIATLGLVWAGMSVFSALRKALNAAWGIKQPRPFIHERLIELGMMIGVSSLLLLSLSLTGGLKVARELSLPLFRGQPINGDLFWQLAPALLAISLTFLTFLFLYRFVPNTQVRWRDVWVGALIAAIGFEISKNVFVWYVGNFPTYSLVYGSVGAIIALLTWAYASTVILLFGAKFTSVYHKVKTLPPVDPGAGYSKEPSKNLSPTAVLLGMAMLTAISFHTVRKLKPKGIS